MQAPKSRGDCSLRLRFSDNPVCMPHVTCTLHDLASHLPFFLNSASTWWQVQFMKLYIMQFSIISYYFRPQKSTHWSALSQTQSTVFPQCHRTRVTPTAIKILCKQTYVYTAIISFWKEKGEQNIMKLQWVFLQIHLLSISSFTNPYCLMPLHNTSSSPLFQNFKECLGYVKFLWCEITIIPFVYTIREET